MNKLLLLFFRRLQKFLQLTDGRDKAIKVSQYTIQVLVLFYLTQPKRPSYTHAAKTFSMTRKILRLGHVVDPFLDFCKEPHWVHAVCIANDVVDDIICLSKLQLLPAWLDSALDPWSSRLWCISVLYDLHHAKGLSRYKLACDFLFVINDLFPNKHTKEIQAWTGLASGCFSMYSNWKKMKLAISE